MWLSFKRDALCMIWTERKMNTWSEEYNYSGMSRTLPGPTGRHADISHKSCLHNVMEGLHLRRNISSWINIHWVSSQTYCLWNGSILVETMALKYIDIIELETLETVFHRLKNVLCRFKVSVQWCGNILMRQTLRLNPCWLTRPCWSAWARAGPYSLVERSLGTGLYTCYREGPVSYTDSYEWWQWIYFS